MASGEIHGLTLGPYAVFGYNSREKLPRLLARSGGRLRVADRTSAYLPLGQAVADSGQIFSAVKSLLRPV